MADNQQNNSGSKGLFRPLKQVLITSFFFFLGITVLITYLNPPWKRPVVACWTPYKFTMLIGVRSVALVAPSDTAYIIRATRAVSRYHRGCINTLAKLPGFEHPCTEVASMCDAGETNG